VKQGLKTLTEWLAPWIGFWQGEMEFKDYVWVAGALEGLLVWGKEVLKNSVWVAGTIDGLLAG
jgi:hypothetical protein